MIFVWLVLGALPLVLAWWLTTVMAGRDARRAPRVYQDIARRTQARWLVSTRR